MDDLATRLATQIMALDWKARKDWTVEEQADRYGELQELIDSALEPPTEKPSAADAEYLRTRVKVPPMQPWCGNCRIGFDCSWCTCGKYGAPSGA